MDSKKAVLIILLIELLVFGCTFKYNDTKAEGYSMAMSNLIGSFNQELKDTHRKLKTPLTGTDLLQLSFNKYASVKQYYLSLEQRVNKLQQEHQRIISSVTYKNLTKKYNKHVLFVRLCYLFGLFVPLFSVALLTGSKPQIQTA